MDLRTKLQLPSPEHPFVQDFDDITQDLEIGSQCSQELQTADVVQEIRPPVWSVEEPSGSCSCSSDADGMQRALLSPSSPTKPPSVKQGPQVAAVVKQGERFNSAQFGAREQLAAFRTELNVETTCFTLFELPVAAVS